MGVDLCGVQILVPQNLLDGFYVHTAGKHHSCCRMAQLMGRELGGIQTCLQKGFFHQPMDGSDADAIIVSGTKQSTVIR